MHTRRALLTGGEQRIQGTGKVCNTTAKLGGFAFPPSRTFVFLYSGTRNCLMGFLSLFPTLTPSRLEVSERGFVPEAKTEMTLCFSDAAVERWTENYAISGGGGLTH